MTARTLALAREIPVHGVCSLDILAAEAIDAGLEEFVVATDARRKEVYVASYAGGRRVNGPQVLKPEDAATEVTVVGRGGLLYPEHFPHATGPEHPSAAVLCDVVLRTLRDPRPRAALPAPPRRRRAREAEAGQLRPVERSGIECRRRPADVHQHPATFACHEASTVEAT